MFAAHSSASDASPCSVSFAPKRCAARSHISYGCTHHPHPSASRSRHLPWSVAVPDPRSPRSVPHFPFGNRQSVRCLDYYNGGTRAKSRSAAFAVLAVFTLACSREISAPYENPLASQTIIATAPARWSLAASAPDRLPRGHRWSSAPTSTEAPSSSSSAPTTSTSCGAIRLESPCGTNRQGGSRSLGHARALPRFPALISLTPMPQSPQPWSSQVRRSESMRSPPITSRTSSVSTRSSETQRHRLATVPAPGRHPAFLANWRHDLQVSLDGKFGA